MVGASGGGSHRVAVLREVVGEWLVERSLPDWFAGNLEQAKLAEDLFVGVVYTAANGGTAYKAERLVTTTGATGSFQALSTLNGWF